MTGELVKFEKRPWYDHMKPGDVALWERFIEKYPEAYESVEYDVDVGEGPPFSTVVNSATGGDDLKLYKKKIDVVAHKGDNIDIIEIKPRAGLGAFGQILSYEILYQMHVNPKAKTQALIITDITIPDMQALAEAHGCKIIVV